MLLLDEHRATLDQAKLLFVLCELTMFPMEIYVEYEHILNFRILQAPLKGMLKVARAKTKVLQLK